MRGSKYMVHSIERVRVLGGRRQGEYKIYQKNPIDIIKDGVSRDPPTTEIESMIVRMSDTKKITQNTANSQNAIGGKAG